MIKGTSSMIRLFALAALAVLCLAMPTKSAQAACSLPTGVAGEIIYNSSNNILQYCDNTSWIGLGGNGQGLTMQSGFPDAVKCINGATSRYMPLVALAAGNYYYGTGDTAGTEYDIWYSSTTGAYVSHQNLAGYDCVTNTWSISSLYTQGRAYNYVGSGNGGGASLGSTLDTQVLFNDGGSTIGGDADMVWDKTTNRLTVAATATTGFVKSGQVELTPVAGSAPLTSAASSGFASMTSAQRTAIASPSEGTMIYNTTDHRPEYFNGSNWLAFGLGNLVGGNGTTSGLAGVSCKQILADGYSTGSGIYWIDVDGISTGTAPFQVYCDMTTNGGGWTACASFKNQQRGATAAAGNDYLSATWNTAGTAFLNASGTVQSYGNFCNAMSFTQLAGQSRSSTTAIQFTTSAVPVTGAPFSVPTNASFTAAGGFISIISRNAVAATPGYFDTASCTATSNGLTQGSVICIGNGTNYQMIMGNINNGTNGDAMCNYSQTCGNSTSQIIVMFAK